MKKTILNYVCAILLVCACGKNDPTPEEPPFPGFDIDNNGCMAPCAVPLQTHLPMR